MVKRYAPAVSLVPPETKFLMVAPDSIRYPVTLLSDFLWVPPLPSPLCQGAVHPLLPLATGLLLVLRRDVKFRIHFLATLEKLRASYLNKHKAGHRFSRNSIQQSPGSKSVWGGP